MRIFLLIFILNLFISAKAYNIDFFSKFNDIFLENYIKEALCYNHDLKKADYTLKEYKYEINRQFAPFFPNLTIGSNYLGTHFPKNDYNFLGKGSAYILPLNFNFEPDLLLKNKDKVKSKQHLYKAQIAKTNEIYISLLTNIATTYINLILNDYLVLKEKEIIENKNANLKSNIKKFNYGIIDSVELNNYLKELSQEEIILNNLVKNQKIALNSLALLIGKSANCSDELKRGTLEKFEYQETIPDIINSDLIYFRPDVIEVENKLKSAKIDVTVAKKEFFPTFNITGLLAFDTNGYGNFFSWNSSFALLAAGLTQDIFKGGEKIANLKLKKANYFKLMEEYKQTDLNAIKEINNILIQIKQDLKSEKNSKEKLELQNKNHNISFKKQKNGLISNMDFINDTIILNQQEQIFAASKALRLVDYFNLYKSVGGKL